MATPAPTSNTEILRRIGAIERRMEDISEKATESRESMQAELHAIKLSIALGSQGQAAISAKLDKLAVQVEALTQDAQRKTGADKTWDKVLDPLFKVAIAVGVAYLLYKAGLK